MHRIPQDPHRGSRPGTGVPPARTGSARLSTLLARTYLPWERTSSGGQRGKQRVMSPDMAEIGRRGEFRHVLDGGDVDPATGRLLSIAQLQAALRAQTGGLLPFADWPDPLNTSAQSRVVAVPAPKPAGGRSVAAPAVAGVESGGWVLLVSTRPGVGCSTTALAIADAGASTGSGVHLIEAGLGAGSRPGLGAVTHQELGTVAGGWRRGRRGLVLLDRPAGGGTRVWPPPEAPVPVPVTILDAGSGWADLPTWAEGRWPGLAGVSAVVVVCPATIPGLGEAERVLTDLHELSCRGVFSVAAVGGRRWRAPLRAAAGPHLIRLETQGRVVTVPSVRCLQVSGPNTQALPRPVTAPARTLLTLSTTPNASEGDPR